MIAEGGNSKWTSVCDVLSTVSLSAEQEGIVRENFYDVAKKVKETAAKSAAKRQAYS